ncbi:unnamed protein product [Bathycoccus prasinos]|jgi:membrane associated rhomboid family serine protease
MRPFVSTNATTTKGARFPHNMGTFTLRATTTFLSIGFSSSRGRRRKGGERGGKGAARNSIRRERHTNAVGIVGNDDGNGNNNSKNEPFTNDPKRKATDALLLSLLAGYSLQLLTRQKATAAFAKVNENVSNGQYYRLLTSAFLHGGLVHLFVNMYSVNAIGSAVERIFGKTHTYAAFTLSALSGNIASYKMSKYPAVGASGAIFGLAGAFAVYLYRHKDVLGSGAEEQLNALGTSLMINAVYGATSARVDNWAHFGGLVGGCTYAYLFGPNFKRDTFGRLKNRPIVDLR